MTGPQLTRAQPTYWRALQCCQQQLCHRWLKGPGIHTSHRGQSPVWDALGKDDPRQGGCLQLRHTLQEP